MNMKILATAAMTVGLLAGCSTYGGGSSYGYSGSNYNRGQPWPASEEGRRFNDGSRVVCRNVEVYKNSRDPDRIGGTVAGAVIGGVLGNQIGSGSGRAAATAIGAVAGGAAGRGIQGQSQEARGDRVVERRCERVYY